MIQDAQRSVVTAIWPWRDREARKAAEPAKKRRHRLLVQTAVGLSAGALMLLFHFRRMGTVAVCVATVIFVVGQAAPRLYDVLDRFVMTAAHAVGQFLTWILLVPFFFLCFLPGRLILMARRKDPMCREFPSRQTTYWIPRPARRKGHFSRQY